MVRIICEDKNWRESERVILTDESGETIVIFENQSSVLGGKIRVYDNEDNELYFLDEDLTSEYSKFDIYKGLDSIATLKRSNNRLYREIKIDAIDAEYDFLLMHGILQKGKTRVAKVRALPNEEITINIYVNDTDIVYIATLLYAVLMLMRR